MVRIDSVLPGGNTELGLFAWLNLIDAVGPTIGCRLFSLFVANAETPTLCLSLSRSLSPLLPFYLLSSLATDRTVAMASAFPEIECDGGDGAAPASSAFAEVVVVRHGETTWNASRIVQVLLRSATSSPLPSSLCMRALLAAISVGSCERLLTYFWVAQVVVLLARLRLAWGITIDRIHLLWDAFG